MDVTKIKEINRNEKSSRITYTSIYDIPILSSDIRLMTHFKIVLLFMREHVPPTVSKHPKLTYWKNKF